MAASHSPRDLPLPSSRYLPREQVEEPSFQIGLDCLVVFVLPILLVIHRRFRAAPCVSSLLPGRLRCLEARGRIRSAERETQLTRHRATAFGHPTGGATGCHDRKTELRGAAAASAAAASPRRSLQPGRGATGRVLGASGQLLRLLGGLLQDPE